MSRTVRLLIVVLAVIGLAAGAAAQSRQPVGSLKVVIVPARSIDSLDGAALYEAYCSSCHGKDLKGYGPAGRFTEVQPIDLTVCAAGHQTQRTRAMHIMAAIGAVHTVAPYRQLDGKTLDMPDWVPIFKAMSRGSQSEGVIRIANISNYIASLQEAKPSKTVMASK
jgi:hypothetical protein